MSKRRFLLPVVFVLLFSTVAHAQFADCSTGLLQMPTARMGRIRALGAEDTYVQDGRAVVFCGEMFSLSMGRGGNGRTYSFRSLSGGTRFTLSERDVQFIQDAIEERD